MAEPFATSADLQARYPADFSDPAAEGRATALLAAASRMVRQRVPGIDARVDLDFELVADVVCEMVWSAITPSTPPGATQQTQSVGSVSVSTTLDGAAVRLRLTDAMLDMLRPPLARARAGATSSLPDAPVATVAEWPYG